MFLVMIIVPRCENSLLVGTLKNEPTLTVTLFSLQIDSAFSKRILPREVRAHNAVSALVCPPKNSAPPLTENRGIAEFPSQYT